ncbi:MAG: helix-turn-helix transcriptional regulator [Anaerolineae bacterium]|nr:helix-turn-helix transcriptional regulator [Anaerolineae bacterium]
MSTRLVILGFLRGRPLYGYELKQLIEHVMGDWTDIAFGSIYFALKKLAEEGFVEKAGTEQEGGRPSRTVYQITDAGREEFMRLLRQVWNNVERQTFDFDIGLSFMSALPIEEVKGCLRKRMTHMEHILQYLETHQAEELADTDHVPTHLATAVFDHHRRHLQAELDWTRELLQDVEQGIYDDELDWMRGLFE